MHNQLFNTIWQWSQAHHPETLAIVLSILALPLYALTSRLALRLQPAGSVGQLLLLRTRPALRALWLLLVLNLDLLLLQQHVPHFPWTGTALRLLLITSVTWMAVRLAQSGGEIVMLRRGGLSLPDDPKLLDTNLQVRGALTRARVLARVASLIIVLVGLSLALMSIPGVRQLGTSLLASAGIAGVVVGFAARPVLSNLLAGLQIALAEPIRINDVLIVQGEWGRVEEITGTYVVFRIWDERRLILPLQWFIEHPFENWTRTSASLLGTVFLWVDYAMPIDALRDELKRVCAADPDWDGRLALIHVTDADAAALQVRFLVSAANSARAWELRCRVREAMVAYMQRAWPDHLPRRRLQWHGDDASQPQLRPTGPN